MNVLYVLYVVIQMSGGNGAAVATSHEHTSKQACDTAKDAIRENLRGGSIIVLTCTPK